MTLTTAQLDALCGGTPTHSKPCPFADCGREFGPYYTKSLVADALAEHIRHQHNRRSDLDDAYERRHGGPQ